MSSRGTRLALQGAGSIRCGVHMVQGAVVRICRAASCRVTQASAVAHARCTPLRYWRKSILPDFCLFFRRPFTSFPKRLLQNRRSYSTWMTENIHRLCSDYQQNDSSMSVPSPLGRKVPLSYKINWTSFSFSKTVRHKAINFLEFPGERCVFSLLSH